MKKLSKILLLIVFAFTLLLGVTACGEVKVEVKWQNGTVIVDDVKISITDAVEFKGIEPTKPATAEFTYTFKGWALEEGGEIIDFTKINLEDYKEDGLVLYAQFDATVNKYTVTWENYNGVELEVDENVVYGATPSFEGGTPLRRRTAEFTYTFKGWEKDGEPVDIATEKVVGDVTYTASFDSTTNAYTVKWINYDGALLETDEEVLYGTTPTYDGATPVKPSTVENRYVFDNWEEEVVPVQGDVTYKAKFKAELMEYNVIWKNDNGEELEFDEGVPYGTKVSFDKDTPTKEATAQYTYTFAGWKKNGNVVDIDNENCIGEVIYIAYYTSTTNTYEIKWLNHDGTELQTDTFEYGYALSKEDYKGLTPTKQGNAQFTYTFSEWSPSLETVKGNKEYTARFTETTNKYTVTWKNYDGSVIKTEAVNYGVTPSQPATPVKQGDAQYRYTFSGWDKEIVAVTGEATYTATFTPVLNKYIITWKNDNGNVLKSENVEYGAMPTAPDNNPTKQATAEFTYTFNGWDKPVVAVTGEATYTATYTETTNKYTITWKNEDGSVLKSEDVYYGVIPTAPDNNPTKQATAEFTYTFSGWDNDIEEVTGEATYTATYTKTTNKYDIVWKNGEQILETDQAVSYGENASYNGATPSKPVEGEYKFVFIGWATEEDGEITADFTVVGNQEYYAVFEKQERVSYNVTFKNQDEILQQSSVLEFSVPEYNGEQPKKEDEQFVYNFAGWGKEGVAVNLEDEIVTEDVVYTAIFTSDTQKYLITFLNEDGTLIKSEYVAYGIVPTAPASPTKDATAEFTYTFNGWGKPVVAVSEDVTYKAEFIETVNKYTITWKNEDGNVLKSEDVYYGVIPTAPDNNPTKQATAEFTYTFNGWDKEVVTVTGEATYTAEFTSTVNQYVIKWKNYDGTVLKAEKVSYGELPVPPENPTKPADAQYTYVFSGWDKTIVKVKGGNTYTATFNSSAKKYTVTWLNYNDAVLEVDDNLDYGFVGISYDSVTPDRASDDYSYEFKGWAETKDGETVDPATYTVNSDLTFYAVYNDTYLPHYTVTWKNYDEKDVEIDESVVIYSTPSYDGDALERESDKQFDYLFKGWSKTNNGDIIDLSAQIITEDTVYYAIYEFSTRKYTIIWQDEDGTQLEKDEGVEYDSTPEFNQNTPGSKGKDDGVYEFKGWTKNGALVNIDNEKVDDNIIYVAYYEKPSASALVSASDLISGNFTAEAGSLAYGDITAFNSADLDNTENFPIDVVKVTATKPSAFVNVSDDTIANIKSVAQQKGKTQINVYVYSEDSAFSIGISSAYKNAKTVMAKNQNAVAASQAKNKFFCYTIDISGLDTLGFVITTNGKTLSFMVEFA